MPPKKKKSEKSASLKKTKSAESGVQDLLFKRNVECNQQRSLLKVVKTKKEQLEIANAEFTTKLEDQKDIIQFLTSQLEMEKERSDEINVEKRKFQLALREKEKEAKNLVQELQGYRDQELDVLKTRVQDLEAELGELKTFRKEKARLEAQLQQYIMQLEEEQEYRERREAEIERKFITKQDQLKSEMKTTLRQTKEKLLAMTEDQLHTTTKKAIIENQQMTIQLQYQSKETENMLTEINKLTEENRNLKQDISLRKSTERKMAQRGHFLAKMVDQLSMEKEKLECKLKATEEALAQCKERPTRTTETIYRAKEDVHHEAEEKMHACYEEAERAQKEASHYQDQLRKFLELQSDTILFIWKCLEDARKEAATHHNKQRTISIQLIKPVGNLSLEEREQLLENLFQKLDGINSMPDFAQQALVSEKQPRRIIIKKNKMKKPSYSNLKDIVKRSTLRRTRITSR